MKEYKNKKEFKLDLINLSPIEIYEEVLSGRYIKNFPMYYWEKPEALENSKIIVKYVIEEIIKLDLETIMIKITTRELKKHKLDGMMSTLFNTSPYLIFENAYPGKFKKWQFYVPNGYWNNETAREATKWLIEEKLKLKDDEIPKIINNRFMEDNFFNLYVYFGESIYKMIDNAYPNKFKRWEFQVPRYYWNNETAREATKWLIEEKLKLKDDDEIISTITYRFLIENGFYGMIGMLFRSSPYLTLENAYPGRFDINKFNIRLKNKKEK